MVKFHVTLPSNYNHSLFNNRFNFAIAFKNDVLQKNIAFHKIKSNTAMEQAIIDELAQLF